MLLSHCVLCPVQTIQNQGSEERVSHLPVATDMMFSLLIHEIQLVALALAAHIEVLAQFNVARSAEDECPPIAPRTETVRIQPVHADIICRPVFSHEICLPPIFELREVLVMIVRNL